MALCRDHREYERSYNDLDSLLEELGRYREALELIVDSGWDHDEAGLQEIASAALRRVP